MYLTKSKKSSYYQIIYEVNGKRTSKSTGKKLKSEALKFLSEFEKNLSLEQKVIPVTLKEFEKEYLSHISLTKTKSYIRSVKLSFKMLNDFFKGEDVLLAKIKTKQIEKFILFTYSRAKYSSVLYYRTLKAAFSKAESWDYVRENPFKRVAIPKIEKNFPVFIDEVQLNRILDEVKEDYLRLLYLTAFYTGMRLSELINLRWEAVQLDKRIITVKNSKTFTTKSKKERIIPIPDILFAKLIEAKPNVINLNGNIEDYIFYRVKGIRLNADFVSKKFKKAVLSAEIDKSVHFHTLRHSYASNLAQRGVSLLLIKELLGHSSLSVTEIYSHLKTDDLVNAVQMLNNY